MIAYFNGKQVHSQLLHFRNEIRGYFCKFRIKKYLCVVNIYWKNCFNSMLCLLICLGNISYVSVALKYAQDMQKL